MALKKYLRLIIFVIFIMILPCSLIHFLDSSCTTYQFINKQAQPEESSILLLAAGDIMIHESQIDAAYCFHREEYDFTDSFAEIVPYLQEGDLVVGNLETTLAGEDMYYTGYPAFNSPEALAHNLKDAGFDLVFTANNHCLDRGEKGVLRTIEHLEKAGLGFIGTARSQGERDRFLTITQNGITVVFLAYTYGTNGIPVPQGKEYLVNLMEEELIKADIKKARESADLLVVSLHWGHEYQREPDPKQTKLAEKIITWGADLVLGSHPHVLQPIEFVRTKSGREGVIVNSLGNLIADQIYPYTDSGVIVRLRYSKNESNLSLVELTGVPTWIHRYYKDGRLSFRVLPVADAIHNYEEGKDAYLTPANYNHLKKVWEETTSHLWLTPYSIMDNILH